MTADTCPCGSGLVYDRCCGPIHRDGAGLGTTAEALMRARYSAHVRGDGGFLLASWHPDTRPPETLVDLGMTWLGLEVMATEGGGALDAEGLVEFRARYRTTVGPGVLHERSRFVRLAGRWVYLDGS